MISAEVAALIGGVLNAMLAAKMGAAMRSRYLMVLFAGIVTIAGWWVYYRHRLDEAFQALLSGSDQVQISRLLIRGQGKQVRIDDPNLTRYLTEAFRSASPEGHTGGVAYMADVHLTTGESVRCALFIPRERGEISISYPDEHYYWIRLPEPVPASLEKLLSELSY